MRKAFVLIFLCISSYGFAQEKENKQKLAPFTIRGNLGIPQGVSSKMFRKSFKAVYEANLSFNLRLAGNLYAGVGYQNTFFRNSETLGKLYYSPNGIYNIPYTTSLTNHSGFLKVGYDKFFSDIGYVSYSLNSGIILSDYGDVNPDTNIANRPYGALKFSAPFVQPEISVNFIAEKRLSFSIMFSYTTMFYNFDPKAPRFNHIEEVKSKSNRYVMSWVNIGFGFSVLLGK